MKRIMIVFMLCLLLTGCGHKSNKEIVDVEQFKCQESIEKVSNILGNTDMKKSVYGNSYYCEYENVNLWGYDGTAIFSLRDDKKTISDFYCKLTLNNKEFEELVSYFSEKYGSYEADSFGDTIKTYKWTIREDDDKIGYDEEEVGYDDIVIQYDGEKKYTVIFSDEWSIIKDEAYYEALEESKKQEEEWETLSKKNYDYDNASMSLSVSIDSKDEYHFSIYLDIEEKWKAAYVYMVLAATIKSAEESIEGFDKLNTMVMLSCGNDFISSTGIGYTTKEPVEIIDVTNWIEEGIKDKNYNADEAEKLEQQMLLDILSFIDN